MKHPQSARLDTQHTYESGTLTRRTDALLIARSWWPARPATKRKTWMRIKWRKSSAAISMYMDGKKGWYPGLGTQKWTNTIRHHTQRWFRYLTRIHMVGETSLTQSVSKSIIEFQAKRTRRDSSMMCLFPVQELHCNWHIFNEWILMFARNNTTNVRVMLQHVSCWISPSIFWLLKQNHRTSTSVTKRVRLGEPRLLNLGGFLHSKSQINMTVSGLRRGLAMYTIPVIFDDICILCKWN